MKRTQLTQSGSVDGRPCAFQPLPHELLGTYSDEQLLAATAGGDSEAFNELYLRYGKFITNYVRRKLHDAEQTDDVVQEIFLRLYRSAARFDPARPLRQWLFTIASNEIRRQWQRSANTPLSLSHAAEDDEGPLERVLTDASQTPEERAVTLVQAQQLLRAIQLLPEFQRQTLLLRAYGELSLKEIAAAMHCPLATVSSRLHYAIERVRQLIGNTAAVA
jgi:RNA polymerase sigma factor (sigma-70 family)